jgi:hypothetical protein
MAPFLVDLELVELVVVLEEVLVLAEQGTQVLQDQVLVDFRSELDAPAD